MNTYSRSFTHPGGATPVDVTLDAWPGATHLDIIQLDNSDELWLRTDGAPAAADTAESAVSPVGAGETRQPVNGHFTRAHIRNNGGDLVVSIVYSTGGRLQFEAVRP